MLLLVVHLLLGYREFRDARYYQDDPLLRRLLGLTRLPDVATICRALAQADPRSVAKVGALSRQLVLDRLHRPSGWGRVQIEEGERAVAEGRQVE